MALIVVGIIIWFQDPFVGDKIFDDNGEFVSIKVLKGGADANDMHGVDAITGGTITSVGVSNMLENTLSGRLLRY